MNYIFEKALPYYGNFEQKSVLYEEVGLYDIKFGIF
jgi:hypothetical protein